MTSEIKRIEGRLAHLVDYFFSDLNSVTIRDFKEYMTLNKEYKRLTGHFYLYKENKKHDKV